MEVDLPLIGSASFFRLLADRAELVDYMTEGSKPLPLFEGCDIKAFSSTPMEVKRAALSLEVLGL